MHTASLERVSGEVVILRPAQGEQRQERSVRSGARWQTRGERRVNLGDYSRGRPVQRGRLQPQRRYPEPDDLRRRSAGRRQDGSFVAAGL